MKLKSIIDKLNKMSKSIKEKDIVEDFPTVLSQIEFIMSLDNKPIRVNNDYEEKIFDVEYPKIEYMAELVKKYLEIKWDNKFSYNLDIVDMLAPNSTGGYNQEEDKTTFQVFGLMSGSINMADTIRAITHEFRHQHLYHFLHESKEENLVKYPSYFIIIAKDTIAKDILVEEDENGNITKPYRDENYKNLYMEIDANNYGIQVSRKIISELYEMYPHKNKKLNDRVHDLQMRLSNQSILVQNELYEEGRLNNIISSEMYLKKPITSKVLVDNESKDRLLFIDKCLKDNPIIRDKYEVLNILMNDYDYKSFSEIFMSRYKSLSNSKEPNKVNAIYDYMIDTDPMLLITKLVIEKDVKEIKKFLRDHPTFKEEYQEEINNLFSTMTTDFDILNLLSKPEYVIMSKKGI